MGLSTTCIGRFAVGNALFHAAAEHKHTLRAGEMPMHAIMLRVRHALRNLDCPIFRDQARSGLPSVIMSRPNSLATTMRVRLSNLQSSRSRINCAIGASISCFISATRVTIHLGIPSLERHVLGSHFHESDPELGQPARQKTPKAEPARIVNVVDLLRLQRKIEGLGCR
jgi:hypothetical protein